MRINPIAVETVGITGGQSQDGWKYLTSQTTTKAVSQSLREGVRIRNIGGTTDAIISVQGLSLGSYTSATGGVGYALAPSTEVFFPVSDLSTVIAKTNTATTTLGVTLTYFGV
jgi:hypothetical protein